MSIDNEKSKTIKLIVEIPTETYLEIKEGSIVRNAMASAEAIKNGIPFDPIKEEIGYEYANTHGIYPEYASGLSHAYEIINKRIDKTDFPQAKDIEPTVENFSKVLDNKLIRDAIQDCETDMRDKQ